MVNLSSNTLDSILSIQITDSYTSTVTSGSGVLFSNGKFVLTAAHLFNDYRSGQRIDIVSANGTILNDLQVYVYHGWDQIDTNFNHDIAIIKLSSRAVSDGLALLNESDINGESFILSGFGNNGAIHTGTNVFDGDGSLFNTSFNTSIIEDTQILYDYDNGLEHQNASKNIFGVNSSSVATDNETLARSGDSGGGLLIDNKISAISSYVYRNSLYDVNSVSDSSFGEVGVATQIFPYISWIDYITEGNPIYSAPSIASNVSTSIAEPFGGSVMNHFLLSTSSIRTESVIFNYSTRSGTATSGVDYAHTQGTVELLPNETAISIGVIIYGDTVAEIDETFSLVLTDPTNEWLGMNVELIATHTIINNDVFIM